MSRKFRINKEPFELGQKMFLKSNVLIEPGITVLVGCNGTGKTTMLRQIKEQMKELDYAYIWFDNQIDGDHSAMQRFLEYGDTEKLATMAFSSEGERIMVVLGEQASKIGRLSINNRDKEIYILFDAVDSGFSIDNICELKELLFDTVLDDHPEDVYIICTANSYEMARGEDCIDVMTCNHVRFGNYEEYRDFILMSKERKEERGW